MTARSAEEKDRETPPAEKQRNKRRRRIKSNEQ